MVRSRHTQRKRKLTERTIKLIEQGYRIVLRSIDDPEYYLQCHTNIAGGPDKAYWSRIPSAMDIDNLEWAFALAPLYNCDVWAVNDTNDKLMRMNQ